MMLGIMQKGRAARRKRGAVNGVVVSLKPQTGIVNGHIVVVVHRNCIPHTVGHVGKQKKNRKKGAETRS